ncbi:MAG TPA: hypothetical protein VJM51_04485 [Dehalococcoidia bacterium]|nr:hypothetical protein [Dehalococcoidia bacterium]
MTAKNMSNSLFRWYARLLWALLAFAVLLPAIIVGLIFFALVSLLS